MEQHVADRLRWGILGTGRIAAALAQAINDSDRAELAAVGSRNQASADAFGERWDAARRHDSYAAVLEDPGVDVVYVALPNQLHAEWSIRCAQAGKHILCEKPIALNAAQAKTIIDAAGRHGVFLMEAFMYRCHPQTRRIVELVHENVVGEVRLIQSNFAFEMAAEWRDKDPRMVNAWAGGGIMDVGCYCTSIARLIAGAARGENGPIEPIDLKGCAHIDPGNRVDTWASAVARFPGDIVATLSCGIMLETDWTVRIWGTKGHIEIPNPWKPPTQGAQFFIHKRGEPQPQVVTVDAGRSLYTIEVETVADAVEGKQAPHPCATWEDTMQNMRTLDRWRASIGLEWDNEPVG
jgi:predicted dehydrogenase